MTTDVAYAMPPIGGTLDYIRSILPSLMPSEQRVALACVERPGDVVALSAGDLAVRSGTSAATVSRACRSLGFRGFQHLRLLLARDLGAAESAGSELPTDERSRVGAAFEDAARSLQAALGSLDLGAFEHAADAIAAARRLLIVAAGGSAPAAQAFALDLIISGRSCEAPADAVTQRLTASVLTPEDVCVVISSSGSNAVTLQSAQTAAAAGATVVAVTSYARSPIAALAAHVLVIGASVSTWEAGVARTNVVQLALLAAVREAVMERVADHDRARAAASKEGFEIVEIAIPEE